MEVILLAKERTNINILLVPLRAVCGGEVTLNKKKRRGKEKGKEKGDGEGEGEGEGEGGRGRGRGGLSRGTR